jgi:hypothetical protein
MLDAAISEYESSEEEEEEVISVLILSENSSCIAF